MLERMFILSIILCGIYFPIVKVGILLIAFILFSFDTVVYNPIHGISIYVYDNYILLQMFSLFSSYIFLSSELEFRWFTLFSIVYNMIVYQTVLLTQWTDPILSVIITTIFQYLDGIPLLFSLVDNLAVTYCYQGIILDEITILFGSYSLSLFLLKIVLYVLCFFIGK